MSVVHAGKVRHDARVGAKLRAEAGGHRLAGRYQAATMVVESPGARYNPLVVHGARGRGKTHLAKAFGAGRLLASRGDDGCANRHREDRRDHREAGQRGHLVDIHQDHLRADIHMLVEGVVGAAVGADVLAQAAGLDARGIGVGERLGARDLVRDGGSGPARLLPRAAWAFPSGLRG